MSPLPMSTRIPIHGPKQKLTDEGRMTRSAHPGTCVAPSRPRWCFILGPLPIVQLVFPRMTGFRVTASLSKSAMACCPRSCQRSRCEATGHSTTSYTLQWKTGCKHTPVGTEAKSFEGLSCIVFDVVRHLRAYKLDRRQDTQHRGMTIELGNRCGTRSKDASRVTFSRHRKNDYATDSDTKRSDPLCTSSYCLTRLRSTCSLWAFVHIGIVERVWEEDIVWPPKPHVNGDTQESSSPPTSVGTASQPAGGATPASASERPPVPPRRRRLWGMASALGKRAVSWGKESGENNKENDKEKEREKEKETDSARKLPIPPPSHPSVPHPHPHAESPTSRAGTLGPPPLPKRNIAQGKAVTDTVVPPSDAQNEIDAPEAKEPDANTDGHGDPDKAESNASDLSTSVEEIIFTPPPSPPPATTSHPVFLEPSAPPVEDQSSSPTPHNVPLPMTPTTPSHISRVTSSDPHPRSRLSSPASPPPSSRPSSLLLAVHAR